MNPRRSRSGKVMTVGAMLVRLISLSWADEQSDIAKRPAASANVMDEVMSTPNKAMPKGVIQRAQCVAVFPGAVQVAVLVGAKHGKGFASCSDQAMKFAESWVRGEPNRAKIALTALSDKVRELV
jgi:lipid-binding SYLF domain-containing protein